MVEFNTILESWRVLRITHSFPESRCIGVSQMSLTWGVSEVVDLACFKGVGPMVGDGAPQGFIMS